MSNAESFSGHHAAVTTPSGGVPHPDADEAAPPLLGRAFLSDWVAEALIDRWVFTPLGKWVTRLLLPTRVRPNQVSFASLVCGALAGIGYGLASPRSFLVAGVFVLCSIVLDAADGELARQRKQTSEMGKFFDNVADSVKTGSMILGLIIGGLRLADWGQGSVLGAAIPVLLLYLGAGGSLLVQVTGRNSWVSRYRLHAKGRQQRAYARSEVVRAELVEMRRQGGFWLERIIAGTLLWFVKDRPAPEDQRARLSPDPDYDAALLPYVRAWTFFGGATQLSAFGLASLLASPRHGALFVAIVMNAGFVALQVGSTLAHRRALTARGA